MFTSPFRKPYQKPFPKQGVAAEDWWLSGGISAGDCEAAYQAKGAASLAASYVNLNNPGTNDAYPGVAPTWDAVNGWIGDGISQYLRTGITPSSGWSALVRYSNGLETGRLFGVDFSTSSRFLIITNNANRIIYGNGGFLLISPALTSGVVGFAGNKGYRNGVQETGDIPTWSGISGEIYLLAGNLSGSAAQFHAGHIQSVVFYNTVISATQILAVTNAMNLL